MAEEGSWFGICRYGLLSTTALLDLYEIEGSDREAVETSHRPESVEISHPVYGSAVIRDQKPMSDSALSACLKGDLTPRDWYVLLNGRVFFWATRERLLRLLNGRAYRGRIHDVLTVDTPSLVNDRRAEILLCPYNSGSTLFNAAPRGLDTFQSIEDYPFEEWRSRRGNNDAVVEVAVRYSVPNAVDYVIRVEQMKGGAVLQTIWER